MQVDSLFYLCLDTLRTRTTEHPYDQRRLSMPTNKEQLQELPALLNVEEVAKLLRTSPRYIRALCGRGQLKAAKVGREWRIPKEDALAFVGLV